jgi:hypothetical protein
MTSANVSTGVIMRIATVLILLAVTACGAAGAEFSGTTTTVLSRGSGAETSTTVTVPDPVPTTTTTLATTTTVAEGSDDGRDTPSEPQPMEAELSNEMLEQIIRHAAERTGVDPGSVEVVSITEEMFNDSSLGCPKPGEFYTQVITPGYIVIVRAGGAELDYRVGTQPEHFKLCES